MQLTGRREGSSQLLEPEEGDVVGRRVYHRRLQENQHDWHKLARFPEAGNGKGIRDRPWRRGFPGRACWRGCVSAVGNLPPAPARVRRRRRPSPASGRWGRRGPVWDWGGAEWSRRAACASVSRRGILLPRLWRARDAGERNSGLRCRDSVREDAVAVLTCWTISAVVLFSHVNYIVQFL